MTNKNDKFKSIAEKRVNAVLDKMRLIGNLSDTRYYEYSNEDAQKVVRALKKGLNEIDSKFKAKKKTDTNSFTFK